MPPKITIVGAGSAVFSVNLIKDICITPNLYGSTVCLMDIDSRRLQTAHILCSRYAQEMGAKLTIRSTLDRTAALLDADFVVITALAAGHDRLQEGWAIARQLGFRFGGSYHVMHDEAFWINFYQLQLIESIIQDGLHLCPSACFLLVANPVMAALTYLGRKYPRVNVVGVCQGFQSVYRISQALQLDEEHFTFEIPGVNHFVWLTRCYYQGKDVFPLLDRYLADQAAHGKPYGDLRPKDVDLYRRFGVFPIGDTTSCGGGAWPWWYHTDDATEQQWGENPPETWHRYFEKTRKAFAESGEIARNSAVKVTDRIPPTRSREVIIPMIESMACDIPRVLIGNIMNSGDFVQGVPRDFEVEIPLLVSKRGAQGIQTTRLPDAVLAYLTAERVGPVNLELQAYEQGSKQLLLQLVMMDPFARTESQCRQLLDAVFSLPYHQALREHFT